MLSFSCLSSRISNEALTFLSESDEFKFPIHFRTPYLNQMLMSAIEHSDTSTVPFDECSLRTAYEGLNLGSFCIAQCRASK